MRSSPDLPAGKDCPLATDRPAMHIGTTATLHTTFHIRLGSELDPKVPFLRHFCSAVHVSADPNPPEVTFTRYSPESRHGRKSSDLGNVVPPCTALGASS